VLRCRNTGLRYQGPRSQVEAKGRVLRLSCNPSSISSALDTLPATRL
jgi:hypothetical protein